MVKIYGEICCNDCTNIQTDPEIQLQCPSCLSQNLRHQPSRSIILCPYNNTLIFANETLSKLHKQLLKGIKARDKLYLEIRAYIYDMKMKGKSFTSKDILQHLNAVSITDGDNVRNILHICVCEGLIKKEFMEKKKYHKYIPQQDIVPCHYLKNFDKGQRKGVYKCEFDFQKSGKKLNARVYF